jgi:hypothetical protein
VLSSPGTPSVSGCLLGSSNSLRPYAHQIELTKLSIFRKHEVTPQRSLFRQVAIEFQQHHRQWGEVALLQPLSTKVMTWFITTAVALVVTFLFLGQYARKETVVGYLTPASGTSRPSRPRASDRGELRQDRAVPARPRAIGCEGAGGGKARKMPDLGICCHPGRYYSSLSQNRLKRITRQASWTKPRKFWAWYSQRTRMRRCHCIQAKKRSTSHRRI